VTRTESRRLPADQLSLERFNAAAQITKEPKRSRGPGANTLQPFRVQAGEKLSLSVTLQIRAADSLRGTNQLKCSRGHLS
jgi:hypothetical protein